MTVHVDSMSTEVSMEPEPRPADDAKQGREWEEEARVAALRSRAARDELRTRAQAYDD